MTTSERMARIDQQFDISFGVFDGRMRDEQGAIAGQRGGRGSTGTGKNGTGGSDASNGGGSESGDGAGNESGNGAGDKGGKQGQGGSGAGGQSGEGQGSGQNSGKGGRTGGGGGYGGGELGGNGPNTAPADIPDGRDDDVVARQLREAAMAETDPELREKLWQEYRNYKKGS